MEYHYPGDANKWRLFLVSPDNDSMTERHTERETDGGGR